jgi:glycosyltransferase involved in cell wall biosynthesis
MQQSMQRYPEISPVHDETDRPSVSVMIPTYNCAKYLQHALRSVLAQAPPQGMHIEVVDDCSQLDDPEAVVREVGGGRVSFFRQSVNCGPQATFTTCIRRARGEWVHILHGDDMVVDGFYEALHDAALAAPKIHAMFCSVTNIDEHNSPIDVFEFGPRQAGIAPDLINRLAVQNLIMFPSIVVRRRAYEELGGFHPELFHSADWDMWKRVAARYPVWYEPRPLALYRVHGQSDTSRLMKTGANIADARHAIDIAASYLPAADAARLSGLARRYHALYAMEIAHQMIAARAWQGACRQVIEGLRCCREAGVWTAAMGVAWAAGSNAWQRRARRG